jgi:hypothetical protein
MTTARRRPDAPTATQSDEQGDSASADAPTVTDPPALPNVHQAISDAMRRMRAVGKWGQNKQDGYAFKRIDDFMTASHAALSEAGVHIVPRVLTRITDESHSTSRGNVMRWVDLEVRFRFYGPQGDHVDVVTWGEGRDASDKATNKALTAAMKYALMYALMVPTQDIQDGDASSPETPDETQQQREHAERVERERQEAREQRERDMQVATADAATVEAIVVDVLAYADTIHDPLARKEQLLLAWADATREGALGCEVRVPAAWARATNGPETCKLHQLISGAADVNLPPSGEAQPVQAEDPDPWATTPEAVKS